jgi:hypothetical protein
MGLFVADCLSDLALLKDQQMRGAITV